MFKDLFKYRPFYWIFVILTAILTYGFALTHISIGVDDDLIFTYANGVSASNGRFGTLITKLFFNSYDFFPFWRDFLGLLLIVIGITLFSNLLNKYSHGLFDEKAMTIFACVSISFPFISTNFIFQAATIETGLVMVLAAMSLYFLAEFILNKQHALNLIFSILLLTYGISFYENACMYFFSGFFMILFVMEMHFDKLREFNKYKVKNMLKASLYALLVLVISIALWKILGQIIIKIYRLQPAHYKDAYMKYGNENFIISALSYFKVIAKYVYYEIFMVLYCIIISFIAIKFYLKKKSLRIFVIATIIMLYSLSTYCYAENLSLQSLLFSNPYILHTIFIIFISVGIIGFISIYFCINYKSFLLLFIGIGIIIAAFSLYFYTGNLRLPFRSVVNLCILVGFAFALLFNTFKNNKKLKYIIGFLIVLVVLNQSKISTDNFFTDYKRYQLDLSLMNNVIYDIEKNQNSNLKIPVVFVGRPENNNIKDGGRGSIEGISVFNFVRDEDIETELNSGILCSFFNMHGYKIYPPNSINKDIIKEEIKDMSSYPQDGYVKKEKDYIIVKLGKSLLENY